ncbi:hypothetical protein [Rhodococcoides kroppenstedtii]|uniref:hypothetical protein n=1 Tax=Rhodococcoides kroppenstedtii TaxID=293050 RepID=UPI0028E50C3E|nr:hypothetical protein [Rhodococcus kroppenstedtii]
MTSLITPEAARLALRLTIALGDVADEDDPTAMAAVYDALRAPDAPNVGAVLLALARSNLASLRARHGDEGARAVLITELARTHAHAGS